MPIDKYDSYSKWRLDQTGFYKISEWKEEGGGQDKIKIHNVQCTILNEAHARNESLWSDIHTVLNSRPAGTKIKFYA